MNSVLAEKLKLQYFPVAILFTDDRPETALQFLEGKRGCVIAMLTAAAKGRTAVFDRKTVGCVGGVAGMCFGNQYDKMPGGIEYFLSTGRGAGYREGEGYIKTPEAAKKFIDSLPYLDIAQKYVVFKPLQEADAAKETPELVCLYATPDQLSALTVLAGYHRDTNDNVVMPFGAGCQSVCLLPYAQKKAAVPKAVVGLTDITARPLVPEGVLSFTVTWEMFEEMEKSSQEENCFLNKAQWQRVADRIG